jgi:hypothetical protein
MQRLPRFPMPHLQSQPDCGRRPVCLRRRILPLRNQLLRLQLQLRLLQQLQHLSLLPRRLACQRQRNLLMLQRILPICQRLHCLLPDLRHLHQRTDQRLHELLRRLHTRERPMQSAPQASTQILSQENAEPAPTTALPATQPLFVRLA